MRHTFFIRFLQQIPRISAKAKEKKTLYVSVSGVLKGNDSPENDGSNIRIGNEAELIQINSQVNFKVRLLIPLLLRL